MRLFNLFVLPIFIVFFASLSLLSHAPPKALDASAKKNVFSAVRAMQHLSVIAKEPHPTGSDALEELRHYLVSELENLGLTIEIQHAEVINESMHGPRIATIDNIIALKKGLDPNAQKLALMAHYDSRENSLGASDDGSGIITILETLRALKSLPELNNDLVVILSDGEEKGLFGAKAFTTHPLIEKIGLVLNFEARGSSGPVIMFETSEGNASLMSEFVKAAPYPNADSLAYAIYKKMPNNTDLTEIKKAGVPGLNFAFSGSFFDYHSMGDSPENISADSVQHAGSYALALTQHFGNLSLPVIDEGTVTENAAYFNISPRLLISYPLSWAYLFAVFPLLLLLSQIRQFRRQTNTSVLSLCWSALSLFALMAWVFVLVQGIYSLIDGSAGIKQPSFFVLLYTQDRLFIGFSLLAVALFSTGIYLISQNVSTKIVITLQLLSVVLIAISGNFQLYLLIMSLSAGLIILQQLKHPQSLLTWHHAGFLVWGFMLTLCLVLLPEAAHLFTWPLLAALLIKQGLQSSFLNINIQTKTIAGSMLGSALAIYWFVSLIKTIYGAVGLSLPGLPVALFSLLICLVIPALIQHIWSSKGLVVVVVLLLGLSICLSTPFLFEFDQRHKRPDSVFYLQDNSRNDVSSYWVSTDNDLPHWSESLFESDENKQRYVDDISHYIPSANSGWWQSGTDNIAIEPTTITVISEKSTKLVSEDNTLREVSFKLTSIQVNDNVSLYFSDKERIISATLNGEEISLPHRNTDDESWMHWRYYGLPKEGIDISLNIAGNAEVTLKILAADWDFSGTLLARPENTMPRFYTYSDAIVLFDQFML